MSVDLVAKVKLLAWNCKHLNNLENFLYLFNISVCVKCFLIITVRI